MFIVQLPITIQQTDNSIQSEINLLSPRHTGRHASWCCRPTLSGYIFNVRHWRRTIDNVGLRICHWTQPPMLAVIVGRENWHSIRLNIRRQCWPIWRGLYVTLSQHLN